MASNKDKLEIITGYLEDDYMLIHFDARKGGVELPQHLMNNPTVTLKLSYGFKGGMEVTEERIWASLLFSGRFSDCFVPMSAIWGATSSSGANTIWPDDAPAEVMAQVIQSLASQHSDDLPTPKPTTRSNPLKSLAKPGKSGVAAPRKQQATKSKAAKKNRPSHLKRIK